MKDRKKDTWKALTVAVLLALGSMPFTAAAAPAASTATDTAASPTAENRQTEAEGKAADPAHVETENITVTASGFEEIAKNAPASVTVITKEEIQKRGYQDLRQVLDSIEGVDTFGSTGYFDTPAISIRGLDDSYTLTLVDGIALSGPGIAGGMMRSFNQFAAASLPAASDIERIEVIRGPMSTLYGSDAMGGVVNIITRKIPKDFHGEASVGNLSETSKGKKDMQRYTLSLGGPITRDKVGIKVRGSYMRRDPSIYGITHEARDFENWNLGTRIAWTPSKNASYYIDIDRGQNMREGDFAQRMSLTTPFGTTVNARPEGEIDQRFDRTKFVLNAENRIGKGTWTNTFSYLKNEVHLHADMGATVSPLPILRVPVDARIRNHMKNTFLTFDSNYLVPISNHTLTVGGRYQKEKVDYHLQRQMMPGASNPIIQSLFSTMARRVNSDDIGDKSRHTWALFAEDVWDLSPKLSFTYGLRYDHPSDYDDNYSPRGYLVYKADPHFTVKGGVATGYKAPTILEASPIDIHVNVGNITYRGKEDLKPEKSTTEEIGFYYDSGHMTSAHLTFFNTDFRNKIELSDEFLDPAAGTVREYENEGKARIHGIELGTAFPLLPKVRGAFNYTFMTSEIRSGERRGQSLRSTPKHAMNLKLDWAPTASTDVWLLGQYRYGMHRTTQVEGLGSTYRPMMVFNLGITHRLPKGYSVQFAINNLFNRNFDRTRIINGTEYGLYYDDMDSDGNAGGSYLSGRSYWLGLTYDF